ncbi:RNA polymerase factor sigma-54 [Legionella impletisoli]|uniref:RNA polymerase sigma-54 factor n=1 Tax=Legionella impletisoli TaxID=343510 RepID=A0A917ND70_9GAMM|nr:RNA polymerase factor sigma-54 [Legionella impletisoli]GGI86345.1 RNA polymerase sigma-54 factor [Legionella impletisoli]
MKPSLQLNVSTQLTLTPQLQQAIRLLQLSSIDLRQEILQVLESNPLLEASIDEAYKTSLEEELLDREDEFSDVQWSTLYTTSSTSNSRFNESEYIFENLHCTKESLQEHLLWQIDLTPMSDIDRAIATTLVDAIDDSGFLTLELQDIHKSLNSKELPIDIKEIEAVLHLIQHLDPVGCGAQNLAETLIIQLKHLQESVPYREITEKIIDEHIELLGQHNYQKIKNIYKIDDTILEQVLNNIMHLNPRPGSLITQTEPGYVIPDLIVKKNGNHWQVALNPDTLPQLSINNSYASMIERANNSVENQFLKTNLQEARWLLKGIQSRQDTLLNVARFIVEFQNDFFEYGDEAMKPLILNDVASALDMHESTISRVTTQKYIHTPRGVFELKFFFSSHVSTNSGGECSSTAIRAFIKKLIAAENPQKPLSDNKLVKLIAEQGIKIARRTVAKYREELGIPPSFERKQIRSSY